MTTIKIVDEQGNVLAGPYPTERTPPVGEEINVGSRREVTRHSTEIGKGTAGGTTQTTIVHTKPLTTSSSSRVSAKAPATARGGRQEVRG